MINKSFSISLVLVMMSACSSTHVNNSDTVVSDSSNLSGNSGGSAKEAVKSNRAPIKEESIKVESPSSTSSDDQYDNLNRAVKTQSDDDISKAASRILLQNPKDVRALNALALVNYKKSRFDTALYLLNKAIAQNTNNSEVHSNLGLVYLATNERREAIRAFKRALEINPQDGVAAANLGAIYTQERDFNKAVIALEIAYKRGFRDTKVSNNYALSLVATGKKVEAESIYKTLIKENSSNKEALFNYVVFLVDHEQRYKEAIEYINRLKFVGVPSESRNRIIALENKAKAGLK